jgi:hypothetical protein
MSTFGDCVYILESSLTSYPKLNEGVAMLLIEMWENMMFANNFNYEEDILPTYINLKKKMENTEVISALESFMTDI